MTSIGYRGLTSAGLGTPAKLVWILAATFGLMGACSSPTVPTGPATVVVSPSTALLVSVGDTVELAAAVRNAGGQPVSAAVTWASGDASVASVDASGRVVAIGNGTVQIRATAGDVSGTAAVTVEQVAEAVEMSGDSLGADVGQPLDSTLVVVLSDARGNPVVGAPVTFTASGSGSVDPSSTMTGSDGSASTTWTLGTVAGIQEVEVSGGYNGEVEELFTANAFALGPSVLALYGGDGQQELISNEVPEPLEVRVQDSFGNGVADIPVLFTVDGGASLQADTIVGVAEVEAFTDIDGVARVELMLGSALGSYAVTASVPDSLSETGLALDGSPLSMAAEAVEFEVAAVTSLVVGDTVTLTGSVFDSELSSNTVLLGGTAATIIGGSPTELSIEVPDFGCIPEGDRTLDVSRDGGAVAQTVTVVPKNQLSLDVGEQLVMTEPSEFCLQFVSGSDDEYLVGLTSTSWFDGGTSFSMEAVDPAAPAPPRSPARGVDSEAQLIRGIPTVLSAEARLRAWEEGLVSRLGAAAQAPRSPPRSVGDVLDVRLPDLNADACIDYVPVSAEVFFAGPRVQIASTETLPVGPARLLLDAALTALQDAFGAAGVDAIASLLGAPIGWDANTRITVILAPEVSGMGLSAYASAVDQLPRATCASSDEGHFVYVAIPQAATVAQFVTALEGAPSELAHQIAHIMQWSARMQFGRNLLPSWIAEGQAELVVDYVGMVLTGLTPQSDLGSSVLSDPRVARWIPQRFDRLARFQGWDGGAGRLAGAPEGCSLFGFSSAVCDAEAGPGAAWSFLRYFSDRFGPTFLNGESGLQQALMDIDFSADLIGQVEDLLGVTLQELIVDWAATLYVDGRLTPAQAPLLQMTSWRLDEMIPAGPRRLEPTPFAFGSFARTGTLVGGGTAYSLVTATGAHDPLSVAVRDGAGGIIADAMGARLWVVRMR